MFPDFLVIGAQKAGTTWLYRNLKVHPRIWMPEEKELHYFDEKIKLEGGLWTRLRGNRPADMRWRRQAGVRFRRFPKQLNLQDLAWDLRYFFRTPNDKWYASLFEQGGGMITGESTPDYSILDRDMIAHVHDIMPKTKIIFMMRSPIERPWSVAEMGLRIKGRSVEDVSDKKFYRQFKNKRTRMMTDYLRTLENWGTFYPEEQIFVGFLEDIHFFPKELLRELYTFLGVDPSVGYRVIKRRIHSGLQSTMPTRFAVYLARIHHQEIGRLAERFGGYASFWLYCAERLLNDPPSEEYIPYPLWESPLWSEWSSGLGGSPGSNPQQVQSGPLSSVRIAG